MDPAIEMGYVYKRWIYIQALELHTIKTVSRGLRGGEGTSRVVQSHEKGIVQYHGLLLLLFFYLPRTANMIPFAADVAKMMRQSTMSNLERILF